MNFFLETLQFIGLFVYYLLEWLVFSVVPRWKKSVRGEIVLITGAGSGVGRHLALKFARLGAAVVLWDINEEGLKESRRLLTEEGATRVHCYICDCSKRQDVYRVADQVKKEVGDVTILINNAGIVTGKKLLDCPDSLMEKTMEVNIMAHFWTYKAFLPAMMACNHGHLVCIAGMTGNAYIADYCASKFAALGFAESMNLEVRDQGKTGIKTTIVCPFLIGTGMFSGCKSKWPSLIPELEPEYVAEQITTAIRQDKQLLLLPRIGHFLVFLKNVTPVKINALLLSYLGDTSSVDDLKSRAKKD